MESGIQSNFGVRYMQKNLERGILEESSSEDRVEKRIEEIISGGVFR